MKCYFIKLNSFKTNIKILDLFKTNIKNLDLFKTNVKISLKYNNVYKKLCVFQCMIHNIIDYANIVFNFNYFEQINTMSEIFNIFF